MAQMQLHQQPLVSQGIHTQDVYLHANIHSHFPLMGHFPKCNQQVWFDVVTTIGTNIIVPKKAQIVDVVNLTNFVFVNDLGKAI